MLDDYYTGSASSSIDATKGTRTIETARESEFGRGSTQPERGMTQHERDDLLRGVGSQFDSVPGHVRIGGRSTAGREHR